MKLIDLKVLTAKAKESTAGTKEVTAMRLLNNNNKKKKEEKADENRHLLEDMLIKWKDQMQCDY